MQVVIDFLHNNVTTVINALIVIATAVMTIIQQFKKQDK